jgi:hypothetical protein
MTRRKATGPSTALTVKRPLTDQDTEVRDATPRKSETQADHLLAVMRANLSRATEPALVTKLREAIDRVQAARRGSP